MRFISKLLRYTAKWCDVISYAWRTRNHMTYGYKNGQDWQAKKGFVRGLRMANQSINWKEIG